MSSIFLTIQSFNSEMKKKALIIYYNMRVDTGENVCARYILG